MCSCADPKILVSQGKTKSLKTNIPCIRDEVVSSIFVATQSHMRIAEKSRLLSVIAACPAPGEKPHIVDVIENTITSSNDCRQVS
jgi:hypothetical protein